MIEIGGRPILWHIMKIYSHYGIKEFVICCGYKGYMIKEYFANYFLHMSDVTFDMTSNKMEVHEQFAEPWRVTLVDTGLETLTGGRLKRVQHYLNREPFCFTYGDGVSNLDIGKLIAFHRQSGRRATITAVEPPSRFGSLQIDGERVTSFREKPTGEQRVNGGFFVLEPTVFDRIAGDHVVWEREPLETLAAEGELACYVHEGFWYAMDTLRDKLHLEQLWQTGQAPWKVWP